ncbi:MAG: SLAC1 anion channel family protein [Bacteroidetes bacterium]|nr:SLAC1 anion channel family protein [Bacteroidota bacterium]
MINYIRHLPIGFFSSVIGLSALAIAWRIAHNLLGVPEWIGTYIGYLAIADFLFVSIIYMVKVFLYWENVKIEFLHPVTGSLFSAIPISCMFIAGLILDHAPVIASSLWHAGAIIMFLFMIVIVHRWLQNKGSIGFANPTWLLPVTGLIGVSFVGFSFPVHAMWLVSQLSFAGGLILSIALFAMVISGLFFSKNQAGREEGAVFILIAPFAMGFLSYIRIEESIDQFADILYYSALFLCIIFLPKLFQLFKAGPFRTSWWAICFPLSLLSIASLRYVEDQNLVLRVPTNISLGILGLTSVVTVIIFFLCLFNLIRGKRL